jgi:predicted O-methyltransferase YrrM
MRSFQKSRAILTGVELDVFTAIGAGATAGDVASRIGANARTTGMLLDALAACGVLIKSNGVYHNTAATHPALTGEGRLSSMHGVHLWDTWSTLTEAVRAGTCVHQPGADAHDEDWTEAFIAAMHRNASARAGGVVAAVGEEGIRRALDVGGGSGAYSIAFAQAWPETTVDLLDLGRVTQIALRHIQAAGVSDRVRTITGDLTKDSLGRDYDLVFVSAICHMLDEEQNIDLIRRCRDACAPGGRLVIQDFILDETRTAPKQAALFALNMMVGTKGGNSYSEGEYRRWLNDAGFTGVRHVPLGPASLIVGRK